MVPGAPAGDFFHDPNQDAAPPGVGVAVGLLPLAAVALPVHGTRRARTPLAKERRRRVGEAAAEEWFGARVSRRSVRRRCYWHCCADPVLYIRKFHFFTLNVFVFCTWKQKRKPDELQSTTSPSPSALPDLAFKLIGKSEGG